MQLEQLNSIPVNVVGVEFEGARRSKTDIFSKSMEECKNSKTFGELTALLNKFSQRMNAMDMFKDVRFLIDKAPDAAEEDDRVIVKIQVEEKRCSIRAGTEVQMNDVGLGAGGIFYNVFGRGERLNLSISAASQSATPLSVDFSKPVGGDPNRWLSLSLYSTLQHYLSDANYKNTVKGSTISYTFGNHILNYTMDWRHLHGINEDASLSIRRNAGHSLKSSLSHTLKHASPGMQAAFPNRGCSMSMKTEFAGIGGSVSFLKTDLHHSFHIPIFRQIVLSFNARMGHVFPLAGHKLSILDKYQLGGPLSVRGFALNSLGPKDRADSVGGNVSMESGIRLSFPFTASTSEILRGQLFLNAGLLGSVSYDNDVRSTLTSLVRNASNVSLGAGIRVKITEDAKLELNVAMPLKMQPTSTFNRGLQVGIGLDFL